MTPALSNFLSAFTMTDLVIPRSEEHTSELQSLAYPVCRLLLEKTRDKNLSFVLRVEVDEHIALQDIKELWQLIEGCLDRKSVV